MAKAGKQELSYCRQCGGDRTHAILADKLVSWADEDAGVDGGDIWAIDQCGGCQTITFVHRRWFSEELDYNSDSDYPTPVMHRKLYPPAPRRKMPEWGHDLATIPMGEMWIVTLLEEIYEAAGLEAYTLVAMGARAIIDHIVTSRADGNSFKAKLGVLVAQTLITVSQSEVISTAFDAGSAAAHRGHRPTESDVFLLLDVAENLIDQFYVLPTRQERQAEAAASLKARTPQRSHAKK